ncbi:MULTISPECIES: Rieske (2Fe-2S) protein [unclassified Streptomyces]|uniref:Rieske (2Fe-2S) protein n=1 Tax=unclassified Streptomyces TaxID=2593676 RepID=UPI0004C5E275|nr:Rieske (2Fe-2S) protein [Streptomyces sp. NRRL F-5727]
MSGVARRTVVAAGGAGLASAALAGCGSSDAEGGTVTGGTDGAPRAPLAKTVDIPVGGGKVLADKGVVITQPKAGEYKAFSSKCTHAGCAVSEVKDGVIICPCHQSRFDMSDGSVTSGPATAPLPPEPIEVTGEEISFG